MKNFKTSVSAIAIIAFAPVTLHAQDTQAENIEDTDFQQPDESIIDDEGLIVVRAGRPKGAVITDYEPVLELDATDVASYGASSITDLLDAIAPQTGSGRGRGSGRPIVLLNGQPVSSFRELRNIPPEAISLVEVLPEEVALQYGYRPDQRVINFILVDNYSSIVLEYSQGLSTAGGYGTSEYEGTYTKFAENSRLNINVEYEPTTALRESERDIIQPDATGAIITDLTDQDVGAFRTLLPATDPFEINATYSTQVEPGTSLSLNANYVRSESTSLFGLNNASLTVPATNPFARLTDDELISIYTDQPRPLTRKTESESIKGGFGLNGLASSWRWSLTGDFDSTATTTITDRRGDFSALSDGLMQTDPALAINPFSGNDLGNLIGPLATDFAESETLTANLLTSVSGSPMTLPAGEVTSTFSAGYSYLTQDSFNARQDSNFATSLSRGVANVAANIDIPIFSQDFGIGSAIGDVSLNGNAGYRQVSDFGGLVEYGFGILWKPIEGMRISATSINADSPPSISQLGSPVILTPNVTIFDQSRGETVLVDVTTGGNPFLVEERQRDIKLAINYSPPKIDELEFTAEYYRNRSFDDSASFPTLTPEIEAAFPDRIIRGDAGQLLAIDRRPVTFDEVNSERIRYGVRFSKQFGREESSGGRGGRRGGRGGGAGGRGARGGGPPPGDSAQQQTPANETKQASENEGTKNSDSQNPSGQNPAQQGDQAQENQTQGEQRQARGAGRRGAGGRRGGGPGGRPSGGRWFAYAYHNIALEETIVIRPGIDPLDLLDGSAIGSSGGSPRHKVDFGGGWFNNGIGIRVNADYKSATRVNGSGLPGSSDLFFGDIVTANARLFFDLSSREKLTEAIPFLKGSRIAIRVDNIFGGIQDVRDGNGDVPLSYQPGFVDPRGRFVEVSFRKTF